MLQFMQQYGIFVGMAVGVGLWSWLFVAYGRAFWFSRRISHLQQITQVLACLTFTLILPFGFGPDPLPPLINAYYCVLLIGSIVMLWRRWYGVVVEPGYASARELLRLRRPLVDPPVRNAEAGLFVPLNVSLDTSPRFSWWALLAGAGILGSVVVVMWILSLLEAAFSN